MTWSKRLFGVFAAIVTGAFLSGCLMAEGPVGKLPVSRDTPFALDVPEKDNYSGGTARSQQPEMPSPPQPTGNPGSPPPAPLQAAPQMPPAPPGQAGTPAMPIQTVNFSGAAKSPGTVRVRAWVNGKPIFEDEIFNMLGPQLRRIYAETPPAQREAEQQKAFNKIVDTLVDNELLVQDAVRRLEKDPKHLQSLKASVATSIRKQIADQMRASKVPTIEEYKQVLLSQGTTLETIRRMLEREIIATEYLRAKIRPPIDRECCHEAIYDYYKDHLNEFMQVDRVKWQDIFIAVGPKHPTMADARQFAEQILRRWAAGEDFNKLLEADDGDSRFRKGDGAGEIKGDIKPRELEPYLFALKQGEFGPPVELTTGVHIYRVLKRDQAGVMPFDDKTQTLIGNKLKNEMAEQEKLHLVRELRERALIEIEK